MHSYWSDSDIANFWFNPMCILTSCCSSPLWYLFVWFEYVNIVLLTVSRYVYVYVPYYTVLYIDYIVVYIQYARPRLPTKFCLSWKQERSLEWFGPLQCKPTKYIGGPIGVRWCSTEPFRMDTVYPFGGPFKPYNVAYLCDLIEGWSTVWLVNKDRPIANKTTG